MSSNEANRQVESVEADATTSPRGADPATLAASVEGELGPGMVLGELAPEAEQEPANDGQLGPGELLDDESLLRALTVLVYASPEPLTDRRLQQLLERPALPRVRAALVALSERLSETRLPLELRQIAGGWQILTVADLGPVVQRLEKVRKAEKLSGAALETLAVVAYRQPVTKAEIEAIRGVQAGPMLRMLVDRGMVRVAGRADVPGHPLQYGTTKGFLERFGLASLEELPRDAELSRDT